MQGKDFVRNFVPLFFLIYLYYIVYGCQNFFYKFFYSLVIISMYGNT